MRDLPYREALAEKLTELRVARAREHKAQIAESAMKDAMRSAVAALDDMTLDAFDRETKARAILTAALTGGQKL